MVNSFCPFYRTSSDVHTTTEERNYRIIYKTLHLNIAGNDMGLETDIYHKCTYSDVIIPFNSCHPLEHKLSTLRFLTNRLKIYHLRNEAIKQEILHIQNVLYNNSFSIQMINKFLDKGNNSINTTDNKDIQSKEKLSTFSFFGNETLYY
jgi:hypothetical protein